MTGIAVPTDVQEPQVPRRGSSKRSGRRWLLLTPALAVLALAIVGPWITPYDPRKVVARPLLPPSGDHWFGTDDNGLDVFSQVIAAARYDVLIALGVVFFATVGGIAVGLAIGMNESQGGPVGWFARLMSRSVDFIQAIPSMLFGLIAVAFFGASTLSLVIILAVILSPYQIRLVRTEVLQVRGEAYVDAARLAGTSEFRLTLRHVLPNAVRPAMYYMSVIFGVSIMLLAALGFLGVGLPPPTPEWGSMVSRGASGVSSGRWWPAAFPLVFLMTTVAMVALGFSAFQRRDDKR
ncbi:MAG: ABC transporter permease [Nocardioidaceae bacterium]|nr:MAG: ABC transporter permease [Nocardioidaceae bacterium]